MEAIESRFITPITRPHFSITFVVKQNLFCLSVGRDFVGILDTKIGAWRTKKKKIIELSSTGGTELEQRIFIVFSSIDTDFGFEKIGKEVNLRFRPKKSLKLITQNSILLYP